MEWSPGWRHLFFHEMARDEPIYTLQGYSCQTVLGVDPVLGRLIQAVRYVVVLVTGFIAGSRTVGAVQYWREWQLWSQREPAAAVAYRSAFTTDLIVAALSLALAGLVWWLLRPTARRE
jgi:hypothetical protein